MQNLIQENYLVVGAGFSGAVLARELVERLNCRVSVVEARSHVAGICHTERDAVSGVMVHKYGPHIFHTNSLHAWEYINRFGVLRPYVSRVKASTSRGIFQLPINLHMINQFFGKKLDPNGARAFLESLGDKSIGEPRNFEEQALKFVGRELYEAFFHGYTRKQWGCEPSELPASILTRLPIRFNYDDNYYDCTHQGIPELGYTAIVEKILDHPGITLQLATPFHRGMEQGYDRTFYTGPIDAYFEFGLGRLGYRTVTFDRIDFEGDYQGAAVINYTELDPPFTRIHEHKHFAPWEKHDLTVAFKEFAKETGPEDEAYYPKDLAIDRQLLAEYRWSAGKLRGVSFIGRLGTYRYLDMDVVIEEALNFSSAFVKSRQEGASPPIFPNQEAAVS